MEEHHHHHRHKKDSATSFKERSLRNIRLRKIIEKVLKITLVVIAVLMGLAVIVVYTLQ